MRTIFFNDGQLKITGVGRGRYRLPIHAKNYPLLADPRFDLDHSVNRGPTPSSPIRAAPITAKRRKGTSRRGYYHAQFESAGARHCAEGVTPSQPSHTSAIVEPSQLSPAVTL